MGAQAARKPRVGFLTTELGAGGAEKIVFELARRLSRERFEVVGAWCLAPAEGFYAGELVRCGVPVWGAGAHSAADLHALWRLRKRLREARLDVLNAHLFHAALAARIVARGARVGKLVVTHHFNERRAWRFAAERLWSARAARVSAVSRTVAATVAAGLRLPLAEVRVVPNGVDLAAIAAKAPAAREESRRRLRLPAAARVVGTVGRLVPEKAPLMLLEAFALLAASDAELRLVYVGDGPLHEKVWRRAKHLGLGERVMITGFQPDVPAALAALDVFALSSRTEGHPVALLEAMAAGLPIAACRIPAVEETVGPDGQAALLVPPGSAQELAAALGRLFADRALAARLGAAAKSLAGERYSVAGMVRGYEELFLEVLGAGEAQGLPAGG